MRGGAASYPEAAKLLEALLEGVPDTQYLEIRTFKKGGGARKRFYSLSQLRVLVLLLQRPSWSDFGHRPSLCTLGIFGRPDFG